jgi:hypothetical protein
MDDEELKIPHDYAGNSEGEESDTNKKEIAASISTVSTTPEKNKRPKGTLFLPQIPALTFLNRLCAETTKIASLAPNLNTQQCHSNPFRHFNRLHPYGNSVLDNLIEHSRI